MMPLLKVHSLEGRRCEGGGLGIKSPFQLHVDCKLERVAKFSNGQLYLLAVSEPGWLIHPLTFEKFGILLNLGIRLLEELFS
jgi:hypothetical protein